MNDVTADQEPITRPRQRFLVLVLVVVLLLVALAVAGWYGWKQWQSWRTQQQDQNQQQVSALENRIEALRRDQRTEGERIQDLTATNRVLRDEVLGLSQRGALLEESVAKLVDSNRQGVAGLRQDEAELELHLAQQRLVIAGDIAGARQAYALAANTLAQLDDPRLLNIKQSLEQERNAVIALGDGPRAQAIQQLDKISAALAQLPQKVEGDDSGRPSWQRVLSPILDVRPSEAPIAVAPSQRAAFENAMQLELTLARAAAERSDQSAFHDAITRASTWLPRLWPASTQAAALQKQLNQLASLPLRPPLPELGSTLSQLQALRGKPASSVSAPAPAPAPAPSTSDTTSPNGSTP